jgi:hypothetical protein
MIIRNPRPNIITIDNFLADPLGVRAEALKASFEYHPEAHKGARAPAHAISEEMSAFLADAVGAQRLRGKLGDEGGPYCCFQICIAGDQLVYHSDHQAYAAVLYLTPDAPVQSGTSFFKSKATGLHSAPVMAYVHVRAGLGVELDADVAENALHALERNTYGGKLLDRTAWEEVDRIGNVFNRLTIWNARLIHAATDYFGTGLGDGRLFQMFFWDAE